MATSFCLVSPRSITQITAPLPDPIPIVEHIETIPEKITKEAQKIGVNPELALAIAECESRFKPDAKNPYSTASGIFQFVSSTWKDTIEEMKLPFGADVFDVDTNIRAGVWLLNKDGTVHWTESEYCWGPKVAHLSLK